MQACDSYLMLGAGYGKEEETCVFELTYNYGQDQYDNFKGEGYGQVALSTEVTWLPVMNSYHSKFHP